MISTGNDIVSLGAINIPRTKQLKFYSRILSPSEQELYNHPEYAAIPFAHFVWLLWSVKESAFKYLQRLNPALVFSPTKFIVTQLGVPDGFAQQDFDTAEITTYGFGDDAFKGIITHGDFTLYARSVIYRELIVSVVNGNDNFEDTCWGVKAIADADPTAQSTGVRAFLADCLQKDFDATPEIKKNTDGIPSVLVNNLILPVSLSHHGKFVSYSFQTGPAFKMANNV